MAGGFVVVRLQRYAGRSRQDLLGREIKKDATSLFLAFSSSHLRRDGPSLGQLCMRARVNSVNQGALKFSHGAALS